MTRVLAISTLGCLLLLCAVTTAYAEVAARTDRFGQYVTTQVVVSGSGGDPQIWTVRGQGGHRTALNPDGDLNGDLRPTIAESPTAPFHPWVIWSRSNGTDYDLVWSSWTGDLGQIAKASDRFEGRSPGEDRLIAGRRD